MLLSSIVWKVSETQQNIQTVIMIPNWAFTFSNLFHLTSLAGAPCWVDEGCNIVVWGERQLPNNDKKNHSLSQATVYPYLFGTLGEKHMIGSMIESSHIKAA